VENPKVFGKPSRRVLGGTHSWHVSASDSKSINPGT